MGMNVLPVITYDHVRNSRETRFGVGVSACFRACCAAAEANTRPDAHASQSRERGFGDGIQRSRLSRWSALCTIMHPCGVRDGML